MTDWNELAKEIHQQCVNAGWWKPWPVKIDRYDTAMMLVVSELSEALEGVRKNLDDDHLPHYKMFAVELADTAIRLLDSAGAFEIDLYRLDYQMKSFSRILQRKTIPEQLMYMTRKAAIAEPSIAISYTFLCVRVMADIHKIDLPALIVEKRHYNAHREDHKEEVRNQEHGKKI